MKKNILLLMLVVILAVLPFFITKKGDFGGSDDKAKSAITVLNPNYKPWFKPLWTPPSPEIESLLFALQASIGAGFIGYYIGLVKGKKQTKL